MRATYVGIEQAQLLREQCQTLRDELIELHASAQLVQDESREAQSRARAVRAVSRQLLRDKLRL